MVQACAKTPTTAPEATAKVAAATPTTKAAEPTPTPAPAAPKEAPALAELVKAGKLPALAERIPQDAMVVKPIQSVGKYGEDVHRVLKGASDLTGWRVIVRDNLVCWNYATGAFTIENNLAGKWEVTPDGKEYTFYLRKGGKWNDGQPLTADDFMFCFTDVMSNKEITPTFPANFASGGKPSVWEKVDDYTVKMKFEAPYSLLPMFLCFLSGSDNTFLAKHQMTQFHPTYAKKEDLDKAIKDAKFEQWFQLYGSKLEYPTLPDMVVAKAWAVTVPFPGQQMVSERNPY